MLLFFLDLICLARNGKHISLLRVYFQRGGPQLADQRAASRENA